MTKEEEVDKLWMEYHELEEMANLDILVNGYGYTAPYEGPMACRRRQAEILHEIVKLTGHLKMERLERP